MELAASVNDMFAVLAYLRKILSNEMEFNISGSLIVVARLFNGIFLFQQNPTTDVHAANASINS